MIHITAQAEVDQVRLRSVDDDIVRRREDVRQNTGAVGIEDFVGADTGIGSYACGANESS